MWSESVVCIVLLIFVYWKIRSKTGSRLIPESIPSFYLTEDIKLEIWQMFEEFFEREFDDFLDFDEFLTKDNRHVLLFRDCNKLQGFIIISIEKNKIIENQCITFIKGEFFAVAKEFRSHSLPLMTLLKYCLYFKLKNPLITSYYFFITYSYKSYLSFGRAMIEYWPCHHHNTPSFEKKSLTLLEEKLPVIGVLILQKLVLSMTNFKVTRED